MHYLDLGKGEVVVLIHGLGSKKEAWTNQFELAEHYRLVIPDVRGHGESNETTDINIQRFASDIITLLDSLKVQKAHICGHSMGGIVAQEIVKQAPERVISLILSNTMSYVPTFFGTIIHNMRKSRLEKVLPKRYTYQSAKRTVYTKTPELINEVQEALRFKPQTYIPSYASIIKTNYLNFLPTIKQRTLVITSREDKIVPYFLSKQTKSLLPNSEMHVFAKTGHMPNIERKEEYNEILIQFLNKQ